MGRIFAKRKKSDSSIVIADASDFFIFFIFALFMQIQNSLYLKLDLNAFKCKEFWICIENAEINKLKKADASEITMDESDFFLFTKICPIFHIQNSWGGK